MIPTHTSPTAAVLVAMHSSKVREALVAMIGALEGYDVVGTACTDEETVNQARRLRPTLVIVDLELPCSGGLWAVETMAREQLASAVIAIGKRDDQATHGRARLAGAHAYIQTGTNVDDIVSALENALLSCTSCSGRAPEDDAISRTSAAADERCN